MNFKKQLMQTSYWMAPACLLMIIGCGEAGAPAGNAPPSPAAAASGGPPAPVPPPVVPPPAASATSPAPADTGTAAPAPPSAPAAAAPVQVTASDDATKKGIAGKNMGKGVLATPASVYLRIPDRAVFMSVQHAMNLYKGEHEKLPKSHDDFMRDIIQANNINLPELPYGSKYVYVPEKEELMIEQNPPM